jgi:uncharacterized protein GlcG (DUF336 family)
LDPGDLRPAYGGLIQEPVMKSARLLAALTCLSLAGAASAQPPAVAPAAPPAPGPSLALALEAAQAAVAACQANGYKAGVTVLDSAGVIKAVLAADGASPRGVNSSHTKATTSLKFKEPSATTQARAEKDPAFAATVTVDPTLNARAGAVLLFSKGVIIGAIGVGGAPGGDKDEACAAAGLAKIRDRL